MFALILSVPACNQLGTSVHREFLRASELLLGLLREARDGHLSPFELRLVSGYVARLGTTPICLESSELLKAVDNILDTIQSP
jgi:hypothetical protein